MRKAFICLSLFGTIAVQAQFWNTTGNTITSANQIGTNATASPYYDVNFKGQGVTAGFIGTSNTSFGVNTINIMNTGTANSSFGVDASKNITTGTYNTSLNNYYVKFIKSQIT